MISIPNSCTDAAWNMAHDEYLLEQVPGMVFSLWQNGPSVIIGRNQSAYAEVNLPFLRKQGIALARRVTGGGAVYHDLGNLNYSIAGPLREMEGALELIPAALRRLGVPVVRTGRNDLTLEGRKCSGYAKRMSKDRILIHGTLMWNVDIDTLTQALAVPGSKLEAAGVASVRSRVVNLRDHLPQYPDILSFRDALSDILAAGDPGIILSSTQKADIDRMADEKFRSWDWIYGHSPVTRFRCRRHFACGNITACYTLRHGVFEALSFEGDFIGARPSEELSALLIDKRLDDLRDIRPDLWFDGLTSEEFVSLFDGLSVS